MHIDFNDATDDATMTTEPLQRLHYHGDDVPEYLPQFLVELTVACHHPTPTVPRLLDKLRRGRKVHVRPCVLRVLSAMTR